MSIPLRAETRRIDATPVDFQIILYDPIPANRIGPRMKKITIISYWSWNNLITVDILRSFRTYLNELEDIVLRELSLNQLRLISSQSTFLFGIQEENRQYNYIVSNEAYGQEFDTNGMNGFLERMNSLIGVIEAALLDGYYSIRDYIREKYSDEETIAEDLDADDFKNGKFVNNLYCIDTTEQYSDNDEDDERQSREQTIKECIEYLAYHTNQYPYIKKLLLDNYMDSRTDIYDIIDDFQRAYFICTGLELNRNITNTMVNIISIIFNFFREIERIEDTYRIDEEDIQLRINGFLRDMVIEQQNINRYRSNFLRYVNINPVQRRLYARLIFNHEQILDDLQDFIVSLEQEKSELDDRSNQEKVFFKNEIRTFINQLFETIEQNIQNDV